MKRGSKVKAQKECHLSEWKVRGQGSQVAARPWASSSRRGGFLESLGSRLGHKGRVGGREKRKALRWSRGG